jgi:PHD/YefM family antitoxin component YafN of YafNO toxin-antitoxin module
MKTVNALAVRKGLGRILDQMARNRSPVCVTRDRKAVAVLLPFETFRQRFVDYLSRDAVDEAMRELERFQSDAIAPDSLAVLTDLREGRAT